MAARTYAEHKADADASLPSPPVVWAVLEVSESEYNHEHVAAASMLFNESVYDYVGRVEVVNDVEQWGVEIKGAGSVVIGQASWPEARRVFAAWWEGSCDATRGRVASNAYGKDAVGNDLEASRAKLTEPDHIAGQPGGSPRRGTRTPSSTRAPAPALSKQW